MGQGEELKTRSQTDIEVQERGEIYFFYRPKVNRDHVSSPDDVQRLYVVLRPESGETSVEVKQQHPDSKQAGGGHGAQEVDIVKTPLLRMIVMGRKTLPDPSKKSRPFWGFVELVTSNIDDVKAALKEEEYDTATRGHRHNPPARALGEGIYRILRHHTGKKMHTHLIYKLELPPAGQENEPQESLNVEREASFLIQIKNPNQQGGSSSQTSFRGLQGKQKPDFPGDLQARFGKLRFHPADPPDFLNYQGCEILLISAADDIEEELGLELKTELEDNGSCSESESDLVKTFGETASTDALLRGVWV